MIVKKVCFLFSHLLLFALKHSVELVFLQWFFSHHQGKCEVQKTAKILLLHGPILADLLTSKDVYP